MSFLRWRGWKPKVRWPRCIDLLLERDLLHPLFLLLSLTLLLFFVVNGPLDLFECSFGIPRIILLVECDQLVTQPIYIAIETTLTQGGIIDQIELFKEECLFFKFFVVVFINDGRNYWNVWARYLRSGFACIFLTWFRLCFFFLFFTIISLVFNSGKLLWTHHHSLFAINLA